GVRYLPPRASLGVGVRSAFPLCVSLPETTGGVRVRWIDSGGGSERFEGVRPVATRSVGQSQQGECHVVVDRSRDHFALSNRRFVLARFFERHQQSALYVQPFDAGRLEQGDFLTIGSNRCSSIAQPALNIALQHVIPRMVRSKANRLIDGS